MRQASTLKSYFSEYAIEAGLDEVGRGCLAGPVVAAAVILPKDYFHPLLNDSKQLSAKQRNTIKLDIEREAISFAISEVDAPTIDKINIYKASMLAMHQAVDALKVIPEHLLVDGNKFISYPLTPHTCIVKGDTKFFSIAAASVLAKTYRDELMEKLALDYPGYGWERNAGYPTILHKKKIIELGLTPLHRLTFRREL
ncbi:ribonuclease HII [Sandaracinomonas limnophila]|uniref:Ribonuclease HII n=1 Tax=Sandaracinomonas limnophila TaxID=1862386 RepID=A0A437PU82_9BACT|nr:ribonuclease HII [Sandaracinomonas limnophila]RVU25806.1 ribonuclease HII [Sandaracinomonas limnophila]